MKIFLGERIVCVIKGKKGNLKRRLKMLKTMYLKFDLIDMKDIIDKELEVFFFGLNLDLFFER